MYVHVIKLIQLDYTIIQLQWQLGQQQVSFPKSKLTIYQGNINFIKESPKSSHWQTECQKYKVSVAALAKLIPATFLVLISTKFIYQNLAKANDQIFFDLPNSIPSNKRLSVSIFFRCLST